MNEQEFRKRVRNQFDAAKGLFGKIKTRERYLAVQTQKHLMRQYTLSYLIPANPYSSDIKSTLSYLDDLDSTSNSVLERGMVGLQNAYCKYLESYVEFPRGNDVSALDVTGLMISLASFNAAIPASIVTAQVDGMFEMIHRGCGFSDDIAMANIFARASIVKGFCFV